MPRPIRPWFRFYVEAVHDRKLRRLRPEVRWLFVACLAAARQSPRPGVLLVGANDPMDAADLADYAALPVRTVAAGMAALERVGVVVRDDSTWVVPSWQARQFESDDVTKRTAKHRSQQEGRNVPTSFQGTGPESESETESIRTSSQPLVGVRPQAVDDGRREVPEEVWTHYAHLKRQQSATPIRNVTGYDRQTIANAKLEHGATAARWWNDFRLTPQELAAGLVDGVAGRYWTRAVSA